MLDYLLVCTLFFLITILGTTIYNKPGLAYDTLEDIAYIILPNKQEFVISVFSNGYQRSTDAGALSLFTEMVIIA